MKIAISVPDSVFASADELAQRLGVSRSQLYAKAMSEYLAKHRGSHITARLDQVYGAEDGHLDARVRSAQARSVTGKSW